MLNLDTHILLHALTGELTARERNLLGREVWGISGIVLWEVSMLQRLRRIELDVRGPEFSRALAAVHVWPIDMAVCRRLWELDFQSDPADELIAATSVAHDVPLVTRDRRIRQSKVVPLAAV